MPNNHNEWGQFVSLDIEDTNFDINQETNLKSYIEIANQFKTLRVPKNSAKIYPMPVNGCFFAEYNDAIYQVIRERHSAYQESLDVLLRYPNLPQTDIDFFDQWSNYKPLIKSYSYSNFEKIKSNQRKEVFMTNLENSINIEKEAKDTSQEQVERMITVTPEGSYEESPKSFKRKRSESNFEAHSTPESERFTVSPDSTAVEPHTKAQKSSALGMFSGPNSQTEGVNPLALKK